MNFTLANDAIKQRCLDVVSTLRTDEQQKYVVTVKPQKSKRSLDQNALLWKWLDIIRLHLADSTGDFFTGEQLNEYFKEKFLPQSFVEIDGTKVICRQSTTKLSVREMHDYLEMIDRYCADRLHLILPVRMPDDHSC